MVEVADDSSLVVRSRGFHGNLSGILTTPEDKEKYVKNEGCGEAVMVCKNHFQKLLNAGQPSKGERVIRDQGKQNNSLLNELTMQEVVWALGKLKKAAPGKDGLTAEMTSKEVLLQVWYELWKEGMMPSIWKQSVVIPVPKKRSRGPCNT